MGVLPRTVLMADDDEDDCLFASKAFEAGGAEAAFVWVADGVELMDYLTVRSRSDGKELPGLILLDLNMPKKDGRSALLEIKANPALANIPIVIFTTSKEQRDVDFTMKAGANLFFTKPATFDEWVQMMKSLAEKWLV